MSSSWFQSPENRVSGLIVRLQQAESVSAVYALALSVEPLFRAGKLNRIHALYAGAHDGRSDGIDQLPHDQ